MAGLGFSMAGQGFSMAVLGLNNIDILWGGVESV